MPLCARVELAPHTSAHSDGGKSGSDGSMAWYGNCVLWGKSIVPHHTTLGDPATRPFFSPLFCPGEKQH